MRSPNLVVVNRTSLTLGFAASRYDTINRTLRLQYTNQVQFPLSKRRGRSYAAARGRLRQRQPQVGQGPLWLDAPPDRLQPRQHPLAEIVSEPGTRSGNEAAEYGPRASTGYLGVDRHV